MANDQERREALTDLLDAAISEARGSVHVVGPANTAAATVKICVEALGFYDREVLHSGSEIRTSGHQPPSG